MGAVASPARLVLGLLVLAALPGPAAAGCASPGGGTVTVAALDALQEALDDACPGTEILIAPGRYVGRILVGPGTAGTAEKPIVVRAKAGLGSVTIDGDGAMITWKFSGSSFVHLRDLQITGGGYHGLFFSEGSHDLRIESSRVFDNHRVRPMTSHAEIKGSGSATGPRPRDILLRGNEIFQSEHPPGSNFQGIDCNFCTGFQVLDNHIHDIRRPTAADYAYYDRGSCLQFKSNSENILIQGNRIERCHIGIVLGGEGLASPENSGGVVRDNIVAETEEFGLAIVNARDFQISGNRIDAGKAAILLAEDGRFPDGTNSGVIEDNDLSQDPLGAAAFDVELRANRLLAPR